VEELPRRAKDNGGRVLWQRVAGDLYASYSRDLRSPVIYELVAAYADHPDFHPEWEPIEVEDPYEPGKDEPSVRARGRAV
jgi:hypothetical protein